MIQLHNCDCMEFMKTLPDKAFELAIVDPPYFKRCGELNFQGNEISTTGIKRNRFKSANWEIPSENYFEQLYRVSENQIIWGCNYFSRFIKDPGRIVWDKKNDRSSFSKAEIASKSYGISVDMFRFLWQGMLQENMLEKELRIHPTQKPVALYKWLLTNYAKPGDRILDTHLGSGSIALACHELGFDLVGCELDKDYFQAASERLARFQQQTLMNI